MKKLTFILLAVILSAAISKNNGNANTDKVQGLDVYVFSTPQRDYKVIKSGRVISSLTGHCGETIKLAVKKAAKAGGDAIIVDLDSLRWQAINYE